MDTITEVQLSSAETSGGSSVAASNHGWQKVTYAKRHRRQNQAPAVAVGDQRSNGFPSNEGPNIFASVEQKAQERRRAIESAAAAAIAVSGSRPEVDSADSDDEDDDSLAEGAARTEKGNEAEEAKKIKVKKPKKHKVTVQETASKIEAADVEVFLAEVSVSYESQQDIQLMRFADYFGRAFSAVGPSQFPWNKMLRESHIAKITEVPICHIPKPVYRASVNWIAQKSPDALGDFVLWCLDGILADLASQQAAAKGTKKATQHSPSKSQVAIFVVAAMSLRQKPESLICVLQKIKDNPKYEGQEKVPVIVWLVSQASQGDLVVGMHAWSHYLFPLINGEVGNPLTRSMALDLVESILSSPKARAMLLNGAVRKGERLVPPPVFDLLMRSTFPSARVKATDRFEAIYTTLKEVALAGSPGSKATKQASQHIITYAIKAMLENNPALTLEATSVFIWCLAQSPDNYKYWEKLHFDNVGASIFVLKRLTNEWKELSTTISLVDALREALKHLRTMNEKALAMSSDNSDIASIKEADKFCKILLGRVTPRSTCMKTSMLLILLAIALGLLVNITCNAKLYLTSVGRGNFSTIAWPPIVAFRSMNVEISGHWMAIKDNKVRFEWSFFVGLRFLQKRSLQRRISDPRGSSVSASLLKNPQIASSAFTWGTVAVLPFYTLMILAPKASLTRRVMENNVPHAALGLLYAYLLCLSWTPETLSVIFATKYFLPEQHLHHAWVSLKFSSYADGLAVTWHDKDVCKRDDHGICMDPLDGCGSVCS
ncbi:hypothetical protein HPP92_021535 [Vanilla planifolia]|uniref:Uncharacterized protein n=1 Tax=Vanilla planifolia TaxID=51239 RepID=A0A835UH99_VANPL|nr:hypothetical protein HPP92_021535 [Vanilla planifolia]